MCNKPISWNFTRNIIVRFMLACLHFKIQLSICLSIGFFEIMQFIYFKLSSFTLHLVVWIKIVLVHFFRRILRISCVFYQDFLKFNGCDNIFCDKGSSINDVGNWEGEGSNIGQNCRQIALKTADIGKGGLKNPENCLRRLWTAPRMGYL